MGFPGSGPGPGQYGEGGGVSTDRRHLVRGRPTPEGSEPVLLPPLSAPHGGRRRGAGPAGARREGGLAVGAGRVGEGAESRGWGQREARQAARGGAGGGSRKQPGQGSGGDSAAAARLGRVRRGPHLPAAGGVCGDCYRRPLRLPSPPLPPSPLPPSGRARGLSSPCRAAAAATAAAAARRNA